MPVPNTDKVANRLINEKSPYLLQHAHNPVDWYPWVPEAFSRAVSEDKPIFLSIGYSTCHWCHVMERESFEDEEVAVILNKNFVCIKVDREERPDIDSIYMSVCQSLTGRGGWPLTVFLTPEKHPFYAGTYYPKQDSSGMLGLMSLLNTVNDTWRNNRKTLLDSAKKIMAFEKTDRRSEVGNITADVIHDAFSQLKYNFDSKYGGFGSAPKFPAPHNLLFLLRYWYSQKEPYALEIVEKTLNSMKNGGIYDHVGFGFSRYSTDKKWLVPHFEKMLYDNALLCLAYAEAFLATGNNSYSETAHQIIDYILRDMTSPEGGFYSAEDADSEGVEGKFYVWSVQEIKDVLGDADGLEYCKLYDITATGNFEGKNIPNRIDEGALPQNKKSFAEACRKKLFAHRENRLHPYKDDKILTAWNGLMIAAMAYCGKVLGEVKYIASAQRCTDFILEKLVRSSDGRLLARYRDGDAALPAYLEDYAFLVWGLLELYEATYEPKYLNKALEFNKTMQELFGAASSAGLFLYGHDSEELITRPRECYDGAIPSGNSVAVMNLLRLARIAAQPELENNANAIIDYFSSDIEAVPTGHSYLLCGYLYSSSDLSSEVVIAGSDCDAMIKAYNSKYHPFTASISHVTSELIDVIPYVSEYSEHKEKAAAYICQNFSCMPPITDVAKFIEILSDSAK
ncbi:MAG: thioredoxin domain-containing protein [Ruminiclostridium sp.]